MNRLGLSQAAAQRLLDEPVLAQRIAGTSAALLIIFGLYDWYIQYNIYMIHDIWI